MSIANKQHSNKQQQEAYVKWCKEHNLDPKQHKNLRRYLNVNSQ